MLMNTIVCCVLLVGVAAPAVAQDATTISGTITTRADGLSLPGATIAIPSLKLETTSGPDGTFRLTIPADRAKGQAVQVTVSFAGLQTQTIQLSLSPGTITRDFALSLSFAEEITVGSRVVGAAGERAVPVDIISAERLASTGMTEVMQAIQALAPSFNFPRPTVSDGTDSVRPATLRGLGPDQVLVLVNGKRRHQTALIHINSTIGRGSTGVDLNAIPLAAVERVEILRDAAAAQYGSDAIAGVLNIVLKSGAQAMVTAQAGGNFGSFTEVTGASREFSDGGSFDFGATYGFKLGPGSLTVSGEFRDRKGTNRAGFDENDQIQAGDAKNNAVPQPNTHWGDAETRDALMFVNAEIPIGGAGTTTSLYGFGGWSRRTGSHGGNFRRALQATNWPNIYPQGFLPLIEPINVDYSLTGGVRGTRQGWFWDVSGQYGHNRLDYYVRNSLNVSLGPDIPPNRTEFYSGAIAFNQFIVNADVSRAMAVDVLAGPLNLAVGFEARRENYQIIAGEPDSYRDGGVPNRDGGRATPGAQVFPGFRPSNETDASRTSVATYVDVEGDVVKRLRVGLAGRFEHYTDFGNTGDAKLTVRFEPDRRVILRSAVSTGFRAPSLGQRYFSTVSTNFVSIGTPPVIQPVEVGTFPVDSPVALALGATPLRPEESVHYSGGVVVEPASGLKATIDVYRIDIDSQIVLSDNFTGGQLTAILAPLGASGARFFTNAIDTKTQGVDLTVDYRVPLGSDNGRLDLTASYNHNTTELVSVIPTPPQLQGFDNTLFSRVAPNDLEFRRYTCAQPKNSFRFSGTYEIGRVGVTA